MEKAHETCLIFDYLSSYCIVTTLHRKFSVEIKLSLISEQVKGAYVVHFQFVYRITVIVGENFVTSLQVRTSERGICYCMYYTCERNIFEYPFSCKGYI